MKSREQLMREAEECARILEVSRTEAERLRIQVYHIEQRLQLIGREVSDLEKSKDSGTSLNSGFVLGGEADKEHADCIQAQAEPQTQIPRDQPGLQPPQYSQARGNALRISGKADFEKILGKSVIGVMAAVLVFISLILFAVVIIPQMTDMAKVFVMYAASLGVTAAGIVGLNRHRGHKGFLALAGCGMGSVYLSLFLSRIYFELFSDVALYLLLLLWGVGLSLISRLKTLFFQVIGEIGIFISLIFGGGLCFFHHDHRKLLFLIIYALLSQLVFVLLDKNRESDGARMVSLLSVSLSVLILSEFMVILSLSREKTFLSLLPHELILMGAALGVSFLSLVLMKKRKDKRGFRVVTGIVLSMGMLSIFSLGNMVMTLDKASAFTHFAAVALLILLVGTEYLARGETLAFSFFKGIAVLLISFYIYDNSPIKALCEDYLAFLLPMAVCFLFGVDRGERRVRKKDYMVYAMILGGFNMPSFLYVNDYTYILVGMMSMAVFLTGCLLMKIWNTAAKVIVYVTFLVFMTVNAVQISENMGMSVVGMAVAACSILLLINLMVRERRVFERELMTNIVNGMIMIQISLIILTIPSGETLSHIFACVVALLSYSMNSANLIEKKEPIMGYYVGIKLAVLVFIIAESYGAERVGISMTLFLYALLCICLGFYFSYRTLRLTGLILSMLSVIKMVLLDISYRNTLQNALGFLVCGMICFAITFIYNRFKT